MPKFCNTCIHWEKLHPTVSSSGICHSADVSLNVKMNYSDMNMDAEGTLWTEPYFGCVYWRENDGSLININKTITDE
jgi:hypothetical protein